MHLNTWAALMIDLLVQQGVTYFVLSPGSRSTPLAVAIAEHPQAEAHIHFDERGAAFHALGYGMATGKPAAIVVTTGTAVGNLLPAIMEASQAFVPLLILSADRPPELQDCCANQTIDQVKIFTPFVRWEVNLPCPDPHLSAHFLRSTLGQAVFRTLDAPRGPVHINCMFREPLLSPSFPIQTCAPCTYGSYEKIPTETTLDHWSKLFNTTEKGIILVGSLPHSISHESIFDVAEKLNWPIFPDIISGMRCYGVSSNVIAYYDLILKQVQELKPDLVLHIGNRVVSKTVQEWLQKQSPLYFSISDHSFRQDPGHLVTHRLTCSPHHFCTSILPFLKERHSSQWLQNWKELSQCIEIPEMTTINEPQIVLGLNALSEEWAVFLANSMPIRDADLFLFPQHKIGPIFSNRGVSGIDGNCATAIGIAQGIKRPVVAVLGDLTFLHDMNSLAQLKQTKYPVIFIVVNNSGGGIFSFLKEIPNHSAFEKFFACSHSFSFLHAAELFDIAYYQPIDHADYLSTFHSCLEKKESCMIEVMTHRGDNFHIHQSYYKAFLCSLTQSQVH